MEERTCAFSGEPIEPGTGVMFVKRDGTVLYFKSSKCRKNFLGLGRIPRRVRWSKKYERAT